MFLFDFIALLKNSLKLNFTLSGNNIINVFIFLFLVIESIKTNVKNYKHLY